MADELTMSLLASWGLSEEIIQKFKDNDIDYRALKELKEDDVAVFFSSLGQRLRFRSGLKSLQPNLQPVVLGVGNDASSECASLHDIDLSSISCHSSFSHSSIAAISDNFSSPVKQETSLETLSKDICAGEFYVVSTYDY